jgi:G3E family GTPase
MSKAAYIMVGGFLGAGKTTAILRLAQRLSTQGQRIGLITNDQSYGLVDTAMLGSHGFPVEEITGGCFCCRFNSLVTAAERLTAESRPDVFIAEPVGSCTDLKATVDYPLRRMYGDAYRIAPLSVLVDPIRAGRILGLEPGRSFSPKVVYIYEKQLEEADVIVINKTDLVDAERLAALEEVLEARFPRARVLAICAREGTGIAAWLETITTNTARTAGAMEVDYDLYAEGEALLGWLNASVQLSGEEEFDGNAFLLRAAREIEERLRREGYEVAHLKMTLSPDEYGNDLGVVNAVRSDAGAELSHSLQEPLDAGQLLVNLRAEADPELLRALTLETFARLQGDTALSLDVEHIEAFRPGRPVPTHRLAAV